MNGILKRFGSMRRRRGAAMVEFAILMLAFVPLILLPMYFQDAMRYKLDAQEAIYSTGWDFAFGDYENSTASSMISSVPSANMDIYKDLWPGFNNDKKDPAGPWADFAWEGDTNAISCEVDSGFMRDAFDMVIPMVNIPADFFDEYNKGGLVTCKGHIAINNHYIPKEFLQNMASKELFPHGDTAIALEDTNFGIFVDPWTIHNAEDTEQNGNGNTPFYERVDFVWKDPITYIAFKGMWFFFIMKLMQKKLSMTAIIWDDPTELKMASFHLPNRKRSVDVSGGRSQFYVSPFEDGASDDYKKTFDKRKKYYMGCPSFNYVCN